MEWRTLPPLAALRAFAAFAETGSVVAAGEALGVSHAAISQQLRVLEQHLDAALLDRKGRSMRLTSTGEKLAAAVRTGFAGMAEAVAEITGAQMARPLHISTTPTFASSWLMPRLPRFREQCPEVDLMIDPTPNLAALSPDGIDVAIRYGSGDWPGLEVERLLLSPTVVVAAPSLVGDGPLPKIDELADLPWLEEFGTSESSRWLRHKGLPEDLRQGRIGVPGNLMLDGARDGQGVAVTVRLVVERDIAAGRLRVLSQDNDTAAGYYLVTRSGVMRPALKEFVRWLRREVAD